LNQPVLHAPWVMTIPKPLREAAEAEAMDDAAQKATAPDDATQKATAPDDAGAVQETLE